MKKRYRTYSDFLVERYGERVYKLPVKLPVTCPNRDGTAGRGGCIFCGEEGGGFESLNASISVKEQLARNKEYIGRKYHVRKFIAYFQNYTNTYMPKAEFERALKEACIDEVVGICVSTRPDCINHDYLSVFSETVKANGMDGYIELGLQTVNYHTLNKINRGHGLAEFIDAVGLSKEYGLNVCAHIILNLPWDDMDDTIECARVLSALKVDQVKLHALYIMKGTELGRMYEEDAIKMISRDEYIERVITFLEYLDPTIILQRLIGRAPEDNSLFVNWGTSWWKIRDEIEARMELRDTWQGIRFDYLNGRCLNKFKEADR
jgi:radical SAM protein (TIGR01212 family)